ncbi:MAG: hypothetical protein COA78_35730 [Blastopirellula sp.]|nr:MAG: hypothetical protein COA78_35730 [Blastopirellula sp.]
MKPGNASAVIVTNEDGRILMQLRDDKGGIFSPNRWGLPGGELENGETYIDGAIRELKEETGIDSTGYLEEFCRLTLDFKPFGYGFVERVIFKCSIEFARDHKTAVNEGQKMEFVDAVPILKSGRAVPYDEFCLWMYLNRVT